MGLATTTENNTGGEVAQMKTGKTLWNASHPMTGTCHAYTQTLSREASSAVRNNSFFVLFLPIPFLDLRRKMNTVGNS